MKKILSIGDCNTLGAGGLEYNAYPEKLGDLLQAKTINSGITMATSREGIAVMSDNQGGEFDCVTIQFGLVDSYKTFKYAPYVPYYPDSFIRKQSRRIVKKYKKVYWNLGLCKTFGEVNVVPFEEYQDNIREMVQLAGSTTVLLLETIPNHNRDRNSEIRRYNTGLKKVAEEYDNCLFIELYEQFEKQLERFYLDATHSNDQGYDFIVNEMTLALRKPENNKICE